MSDYGHCIPDCPICGGLGWVRKAKTDSIHDPDFGKIERCPNAKMTYIDPELGIQVEEAKHIKTEAVKSIRKVVDGIFEKGCGWAYIYGQPGNGKTIMVKSATIYASLVLSWKARYRRLSELMNDFRSLYDLENGQIAYRDALKTWGSYKWLVVDEIGRDRQTDFSKQTLSELMDRRYQLATSRKGVTIWVSNYKPEEVLEQYQIDRVRDGRFQVVEIKTPSVRPVMQYKDEKELDNPWWNRY